MLPEIAGPLLRSGACRRTPPGRQVKIGAAEGQA